MGLYMNTDNIQHSFIQNRRQTMKLEILWNRCNMIFNHPSALFLLYMKFLGIRDTDMISQSADMILFCTMESHIHGYDTNKRKSYRKKLYTFYDSSLQMTKLLDI